jgi:hypothetical protein
VVLSKGSLLVVPDVEMVASTEAQLEFSWVNNAAAGSTNGSDKLTIGAYNSEKQGYVKMDGAAVRSALSYVLLVPSSWSRDNVHVWGFFVRADGKQVSDSVYLEASTII